jgi:type II secretory pathway component PulM
MNQILGLFSNYFARLAPRERLLLGVAALSVVVICLYSFVWEPLQTGHELLERRIVAKEGQLLEMIEQRDVYLDIQRQLEANQAAISEGDPDFNLFAYLQNAITAAVSRDRITSMNPSEKGIGDEYVEELVDIKLTQISLPQLVDLLYRIEKGTHPLRFSRLQIKKRPRDIYNFDVNASVSLLRKTAAGETS